jgi:Pyruvate/2-oxoacid:ferredoxin oxidoreductase delta subunit
MRAADLFRFDYFRCLRSEFAKNGCTLCIDLCPEDAMLFDRKKLTLDADRCTGCAACMGSCPTGALMSDAFDPDRFVLEFSAGKGSLISCRENVPCLAALSSEHLIAIALRKEGETLCDLSHCAECGINREGKVLAAIEGMIEESGRFLALCGREKGLSVERGSGTGAPEAGRRGLLKKLAGVTREMGEGETMAELMVSKEEKQPLKRILLKNSMKRVAEDFPQARTVEGRFSFVTGKRIDAESCTNCQECAMFCPTDALSVTQDNTGIIFQMGKCIACGICNDVCQPRSIHDDETLDLVAFAFDRMQLLVKHMLEICEECKVAFPYRGGEKVCDRCRDFKANFSDLFTLAKDLE